MRYAASFNRSITITLCENLLTEDVGALVLRDAADQIGLTEGLKALHDCRSPTHLTHPLQELVLTRIFLNALGWRDQDDANKLREDPSFRMAVSKRRGDILNPSATKPLEPIGLASQPTLSRSLQHLAAEKNQSVLEELLLQIAAEGTALELAPHEPLILDVDSCPIKAHGRQEGAVYNGYYAKTVCHPNTLFSASGDLWAVQMRPGNVHTAHDVRSFIEPALERAKTITKDVWLRFDTGYASGHFFDWLEARNVHWVTRLKSQQVLTREVETWRKDLIDQWTAAPSDRVRTATKEFSYAAKKWSKARRVMAVLVERSQHSKQEEMFHHLFFLSTSASVKDLDSEQLLKRYRARGNVERHIGELVGVLRPKVSSATLAQNHASLLLSALAYQVMHHVRERLESVTREGISLCRLRERFLKVAAVVIRHARQVVFRISSAKVALWQVLNEAMAPPGPAACQEVQA